MVGFNTGADNYFIFLALLFISGNIGSSFGMLLGKYILSFIYINFIYTGTLARDAAVGVTLIPVTLIPTLIFSGFFVNLAALPNWLSWIQYISFFKYAFRAAVINEFTDLKFTCTESERIQTVDGYTCRINNGEEVITELGFDNWALYKDFLILLAFFFGIRILNFIALYNISKKKSNA